MNPIPRPGNERPSFGPVTNPKGGGFVHLERLVSFAFLIQLTKEIKKAKKNRNTWSRKFFQIKLGVYVERGTAGPCQMKGMIVVGLQIMTY